MRFERTFPFITKQELEKLYLDKAMSTRQVAAHFGCSHFKILQHLKKYNIPRRKTGRHKGYHSHRKGKSFDQQYGKQRAEEIKEKMRTNTSVKRLAVRKKISESVSLYWHSNKEFREKMLPHLRKLSEENRIKNAADPKRKERLKQLNKNSEFQKKRLRGLLKRPTLPERKLLRILQHLNLNFEYVGDGKLIIDRKCPDFSDGKGKLIEVFGDYWHSPEQVKNRTRFFSERGYDCLVIWQHEFQNKDRVIEKLEDYVNV